jgi:hypothetical protein
MLFSFQLAPSKMEYGIRNIVGKWNMEYKLLKWNGIWNIKLKYSMLRGRCLNFEDLRNMTGYPIGRC